MLRHLAAAALLGLFISGMSLAADWPSWRGPQRDGISTETGLLKQWPEEGPAVAWDVDTVGVGYSSLAVVGDRIYTQGDLDGVEHVICLDAKTGKTLWAVQPEPVAAALAAQVAEEMKRTDANGDSLLDEGEALGRFGWNFNKFDSQAEGDPTAIAAARTARAMKLLDADQNGKLSGEEVAATFGSEFSRIDSEEKEADAEALAKSRTADFIKALDQDGDGKISRDESRRTLLDSSFGRIDERDPATNKSDQLLTAGELEAYLAKYEKGRDGLISAAELESYYAKQLPGRDGNITAAELRGNFGGYRNGQGDGPRGTPTVDGDRLYAEGGNGDLTCLDAKTGKTIWHLNLAKDLGGGRPGWGYCESPLVDENQLIVTPGGKQGTIVSLDKYTGKPIWRSEGVTQSAHYSSPVLADIGGVRQIVQFARENVFGVAANSGQFLWSYSGAANGTANCATPLVWKDHVFTTSSYGTGGGLAKIAADGNGQKAEEVYFEQKMANHHGGVIRVNDHIYGFGNGGLMCMDFLTGEIVWKARSVSKGSLVVADGQMYLLGEGHQMALAEVTPEEYRETGRFKITSHGRPSWAHPVVAGGKLYIRNQHQLTAYDIRAKASE